MKDIQYLDKNGTPIYFISYYDDEDLYAVWKFNKNGNDLIETFTYIKNAEKLIKRKLGILSRFLAVK